MMTLTYPRSGSNYLRQLVQQQLNYTLRASHHIQDAKGLIITLARDPYDSIQSQITMALHYDQPIDIQQTIYQYIDTYRFLYNRANVVVDYDTLVSSPQKVLEFLSEIMREHEINFHYDSDLHDDPNQRYLVSSKTSELYKQDYLSDFDLSVAYQVYHLLVSRRTI